MNLYLFTKTQNLTLWEVDEFLGNLKLMANNEGKKVPRYFSDFCAELYLGERQTYPKQDLLKADINLLSVRWKWEIYGSLLGKT